MHEAQAFIAQHSARGTTSHATASSSSAAVSTTTRSSQTKTINAYSVKSGPSGASVVVAAPSPSHGRKKKASTSRDAKPNVPPSPYPDVPPNEEHLWDIVYTDGACSNNQAGADVARAGVGVWFGYNDLRFVRSRVCSLGRG